MDLGPSQLDRFGLRVVRLQFLAARGAVSHLVDPFSLLLQDCLWHFRADLI